MTARTNVLTRLGLRLGLIETAGKAGANAPLPLVIPAGIAFNGVLVSDRDVVVQGAVKGSVICPLHRVTVVLGASVVHGTVHAQHVEWVGEVSACEIVCETLRVDAQATSDARRGATRAAYQKLRIATGVAVDVTLVHRPFHPASPPQRVPAPVTSILPLAA